MRRNTGKDSEKFFEETLKKHYLSKVFIYRITDTAEVRGRATQYAKFNAVTKAQYCDYIITCAGDTYMAEVKSTSEKVSFPFSMITTVQWGASKRQVLAEGKYIFYIHNMNTDTWYEVPAQILHKIEEEGKKSVKWKDLENYIWRLK